MNSLKSTRMKKNSYQTEVQYTNFLIEKLKSKSSLYSVSRLSPFAWLHSTNRSYKEEILKFVKSGNEVKRITLFPKKESFENIFVTEILTRKSTYSAFDDQSFKNYIGRVYNNENSSYYKNTYNNFKKSLYYIILDSLQIFTFIHSSNGALLPNEEQHGCDIPNSLKDNHEILIYNDEAFTIQKKGEKYEILIVDKEELLNEWQKGFNYLKENYDDIKLEKLIINTENLYKITDFKKKEIDLINRLNSGFFISYNDNSKPVKIDKQSGN